MCTKVCKNTCFCYRSHSFKGVLYRDGIDIISIPSHYVFTNINNFYSDIILLITN